MTNCGFPVCELVWETEKWWVSIALAESPKETDGEGEELIGGR